MDSKNIKDVPDSIFNLFQKAQQAYKLNNIDYAIELLKTAVVKEPAFIEARKQLRLYELAKQQSSILGKFFKGIMQNKNLKLAQMQAAMKKYKEAYAKLEEALAISIHTPSGLKLLAEIGEGFEAEFIVIEALDLAVQLFPKNFDLLTFAAEKYREHNQGIKEVDARKKIVAIKPNDLKLKMQMREASALATMEKSDWENKDKSFTEKLKSKKESAAIEAEERIVKKEDEVKELIENLNSQLEKDPQSISALRELGDLYFNIGYFDEAIEKFKKLMVVRNVFDLTLDTKIEKAKIKIIEHKISELKSIMTEENKENIFSEISNLKQEILILRRKTAEYRIERYPNDMQIRFAYGKICWEMNDLDKAIEQFQLSQANLNRLIPSLLYLGRCFMAKKQYDIASEQFLKVLDETRTTAEQQLEALYHLGLSYEKLGNEENAGKCFKKIYSAKSTYKDISEIIKRYY